MKISKIVQQEKYKERYSVFVDGSYSFSLSESALLESKLYTGQELSREDVKDFKRLSADDKLYSQSLRFVALRPRSVWEMQQYLKRKEASPSLITHILNKLMNLDLLNDEAYARAFVADRRQLRPTARRKLIAELRKKNIASDIIEQVVGHEARDEQTALNDLISRKRKLTKYQDDLRLMQYLARQGFSYDDIKHALSAELD